MRPRPNNSGFSAIAPTVAPPTTFSAHAVAIPVPAIVIAAESAAIGSAMSLYLLCRTRAKRAERSSVPLEELDKRLHVVQPERLYSGRDPTEEEDEKLGEEEEDEPHDHVSEAPRKNQILENQRVERCGNRRLPYRDPGEPRV